MVPAKHNEQANILVVEDEPDIARLITLHLEDAGYGVSLATDGHRGLSEALARDWDLVMLDLRLPGPDGLAICRAIRKASSWVPVLMVTAKTTELDRVLGLELGADDYVTKPFSVVELVARVKALLRRTRAIAESQPEVEQALVAGPLHIEPAGREVAIDGEQVELTAREFDLLSHFARHPGQVFSRAQLLDQVWGYGHEGYEHTVNSHINRLRAKIEPDSAHPRYVVTVWGVGYKLDLPRPASQLRAV